MKHVYAGLAVAAILIGAIVILAGIWWLLSQFIGPGLAAGVLAVVVVVFAASALIDWITDKK